MYISTKASLARQREAENARRNRAEIVRALSIGQITRRDLYKWGIFTVTGALALKNGLSPFARSAFAAVPTGTPRSPLGTVQRFTQALPRLALQTPTKMYKDANGNAVFDPTSPLAGELPAKRLSYHVDFDAAGGNTNPNNPFRNPITGRGPIEGRPGNVPSPPFDARVREAFAHQRWEEFFPQVGYVM